MKHYPVSLLIVFTGDKLIGADFRVNFNNELRPLNSSAAKRDTEAMIIYPSIGGSAAIGVLQCSDCGPHPYAVPLLPFNHARDWSSG